MNERKLGQDMQVSVLGLGCIGMDSSFPPFAEKQEMIALIRTAVEHGSPSSTPPRSTVRSRTRSSSARRSNRSVTRL
jgi:hypothetical protein